MVGRPEEKLAAGFPLMLLVAPDLCKSIDEWAATFDAHAHVTTRKVVHTGNDQ